MANNTLPAWQPPPDFAPIQSALPGITVFAPRQKDDQAGALQSFKCPQCGATTGFDVAAGGVAFKHCGYQSSPQTETVGLQAEGMEFTLETLSKANLGWGLARNTSAISCCVLITSLCIGRSNCCRSMSHGCNSENVSGLDKIVALPESRRSIKTLLKEKATNGIVPYRHFFA
jgi:hypothetical protein